eukprot:GHVU01198198.1.p1 GENE.GHVU01198198.1~~GHVU01198198.1.p1  ORF type:complete len:105 (+),score=24.56 GHVU01198198.1:143-457(+)
MGYLQRKGRKRNRGKMRSKAFASADYRAERAEWAEVGHATPRMAGNKEARATEAQGYEELIAVEEEQAGCNRAPWAEEKARLQQPGRFRISSPRRTKKGKKWGG